MMLYLVNQEAADFLSMLEKKKLAISHSSSTKIISTFRSGRKSFRKDPANNFFKIINMTRYLVTLLTQSPNLK